MPLRRSLPGSLGVLLCLVSFLSAQHVTAPMLPYKDGDVSIKSGEGDDEALLVADGRDYRSKEKGNIAWITFLSQTVDLAHANRATLSLNLNALKKSGILHIHILSAPIDKPEHKVGWADVRYNSSPVASMRIESSMVDMIITLDITPAMQAGPFHGLALVGEGNLQAAFSSRESGMPPIIHLHYPALTGPQGPMGEEGIAGVDGKDGKDGVAGAVGPTGPMGPQGIPGETGAMGPMGPQGSQGETGAIGPRGIAGETGPMGPMGMTGPQGEAGPMGPPGPGSETSWVESNDSLTTRKLVGIGTTHPQSDLHVVGDVMVSGQIRGATFGFGGMYQKDDCNVNTVVNPLTGGLTCPPGFTAHRAGRLLAPESRCGANQFICIK